MSTGQVKPANYQTCVCGRVCKGRAALSNHARKCEVERVRVAADTFAISIGRRPLSTATFLANFDAISASLATN